MKSPQQQIFWITGASTGIGAQLALSLSKLGHIIIISARNHENLQKIKSQSPDNIHCLSLDITNHSECKNAQLWIEKKFGYLDCAILNAGTCEYLDVKSFDVELIERVMQTNFFGFINCLEIALPLLREAKKHTQKNPYLVGISSSAAYSGLPRSEAYGASKAAMSHFLDSFRADITPEKIDVSIVYPGFVETPLTDKNDFPMPMRISSEKAAHYIIKGMKKRQYEIHFPKMFTFLLRAYALLPSKIRNRLNQRIVRTS